MPTNNMGPYYSTGAAGSGNVPTPTGVQNPSQSPSGSVTGQAATYNFSVGISSTQEDLNGIGENIAQQGTAVSNVAVKLAGVDPAAIQQNNWYAGSYGTPGSKFS